MFGAETPFLLIGIVIILGVVIGATATTKLFRIRGRKNDESKA